MASPHVAGSALYPGHHSGALPAAPVLKGTSAKRAIKLTWTAPSNGGSPITHYRLTRSTSANGAYTQIATPSASATSWTDGVASRSTCFYRLVAVNTVSGLPAVEHGDRHRQ